MNPTDDVIDQAFQGLRTHVTQSAYGPPATEIISRGRRRRTARFVAVAIAVVAVIGAGTAVADHHNAAMPAAPHFTPSGTRTDPAGTIPSGLLTYLEAGEDNVDHDCFGDPKANVNAQTPLKSQTLYVYPDDTAATAAYEATREHLAACTGFPDPVVTVARTDEGWGDQAAAMTIQKPADGAGEHTGDPLRITVVRTGTALLISYGYPPHPTEVDEDTELMSRKMCIYGTCVPRKDSPQQLSTLHNGGEAWAATIEAHTPDIESDGLPGEGIGQAAVLGYHAYVVSAGCDEGGYAPDGPQTRSTVVYFASEADAQAFRLLANTEVIRESAIEVTKVRTWCA